MQHPPWFALWRVLLSAVTQGGAGRVARRILRSRLGGRPRCADGRGCQIGAFFALLHLALQVVPVGPPTLLAATTQLWRLPILALLLDDRPGSARLLPGALGLGRILVLADPAPAPIAGVAPVSLALSALVPREEVAPRLVLGAALILAPLLVLAVRRALPPTPGSGTTPR
jgi:drug/metabolite transporter (DMT)-like permease